MSKTEPGPFEVRANESLEEFRERVMALYDTGFGTADVQNPRARGADIDKRARELLTAAGIERPDFRQYRDACAMAAAQLDYRGQR